MPPLGAPPATLASHLMGEGTYISPSLLPLLGSDDFEAALGLAEMMSAGKAGSAVQPVVTALYTCMFRLYSDEMSRQRMLSGIISRASGATFSSEASSSSAPGGDVKAGGSKDAAGGGRGAGPSGGKAALGKALKGGADSKAGSSLSREILLSLVEEPSGCARPAMEAMLDGIAQLNGDKSRLAAQLAEAREEAASQRGDIVAVRAASEKAREHDLSRIKGLEKASEKAKAERAAEVERMLEEKRDLEAKLRESENQADWARGERDEEVARAGREKRELSQRLKDAEQQLLRLKSTKKDDLKRITKERNTFAEKVKEQEVTQRRLEEELKRLRDESARGRKEVERASGLEEARAGADKRAAAAAEQLAAAKTYIGQLEGKVNQLQSHASGLQAAVSEEMNRHAPLYGVGLESLMDSELNTIMSIHEDGLHRIQTIFAQRQQPGGGSGVRHAHSAVGLSSTVGSVIQALGPSAINGDSDVASGGGGGGLPGRSSSMGSFPGVPPAPGGLGLVGSGSPLRGRGGGGQPGGARGGFGFGGQQGGGSAAFPSSGLGGIGTGFAVPRNLNKDGSGGGGGSMW